MEQRVLGVLAGQDMPLSFLSRWAASAHLLLAADGGANRLIEAGHVPHEIIGDLDSADPEALSSGAHVIKDPSAHATDCDKLLEFAEGQGLEAITLASIEGDLPDHVLATLHSAARASLDVRFAMRRGLGWIVRPDKERIVKTQASRRVSLLPLEECRGVHMSGVEWALQGADLYPRGLTSISNKTSSDAATIQLTSGAAFLFVEYPPEEMPFW